jgi:hypothetical protein
MLLYGGLHNSLAYAEALVETQVSLLAMYLTG